MCPTAEQILSGLSANQKHAGVDVRFPAGTFGNGENADVTAGKLFVTSADEVRVRFSLSGRGGEGVWSLPFNPNTDFTVI